MSGSGRCLRSASIVAFLTLAASCAGSPSEGGSGGAGPGSGGTGTGTGGGSGGAATGGSAPSASGGSASGGRNATGGASGGATGGVVGTGTGGTAGARTGGASGTGAGGAAGATGAGGTPVINPTACSTGAAQTGDVTVNLSSLQQKITGFGVSSAWSGSFANASDPDYLWSTTKGAGLTLLRVRYGDGLAIAQSAAKAGVTVWLTPWGTGSNGSPGGTYTTTQNNPNGCTSGNMPVLTNLTGFASALVTWIQNAKTQGVPIYAVSAGNEPDSCGINQTTSYSAAQLAAWIDVLGPAMAAIGVKIMAPETMNACGFTSYFSAIQKDTAAWNAVSIFASHEYGCGSLPSEPTIAAAGKEYWETEVDTGTAKGDSSGDGIASALLMGQAIHNDLTKGNLNAWLLWWLYEGGNSGGCLYDTGSKVWTKRLWVMGNYSRFVRPGYMRVSTSGTAPTGVLLTAYKNPADGTVVVVAINNNTAATPVSLYVSGAVPCTITPWVTSATDNLASQTPITVSNARFSATLAARSVTTFVGTP
jgi:glucuronoarabinoxylan endo-1,4-beta-xylanase